MPRWKIAAVQMDCAFADKPKNLEAIRARLREAAGNGAQLVIFPEWEREDELRIGMNICYDGSFPEAARCLMLLGADLIVLPTNWPTGAISTAKTLIPARALENHLYYAAVNRVGTERGFQFIGM